MEGDFIKINKALLPLSWLYGLGVAVRNLLFDLGVRRSYSFKTPVISVGNITVGGTGKTPHVEYLVRLLKEHYNVAVLSRGYKRKSSGFIIADDDTPMSAIGDEPFQMKQKFPDVIVAVDKDRVHGINELTDHDSKDGDVDVVLLDDAYQHRRVKPGINILLVDYHRLVIYDELLPAGRLREPLKGKDRANIVIVTKCPKELKPMEFRVLSKAMNLFPYQSLYFSTLVYEPLKPVFHNPNDLNDLNDLKALKNLNILLLTGIALPRQMLEDMSGTVRSIKTLTFADHHQFSHSDVNRINKAFDELPSPRCIVTTEKDAARLIGVEGLSDEVRRNMWVQPVKISIMQDQQEDFDNQIADYVMTNGRRRKKMKLKAKIANDSRNVRDHKTISNSKPGETTPQKFTIKF